MALIGNAIDAGINFFDTADTYSHGQSEVLLGKAVRSRRGEVVLATKGGYIRPAQSVLSRVKPIVRPVVRALRLRRPSGYAIHGAPANQDFSPRHLVGAFEASLRRLGTDYVDIYQLHSPPQSVIDSGEFVEPLERLKAQGKIRNYGIAADRAADVERFDRHPTVTALQLPFSAIEQDASRAVLPKAVLTGVGVISRSCFAAGLLVGDQSEAELRERTPDADAIMSFRQTARTVERPVKELALQFNLQTSSIAVTVIGMRTPAQLDEILRYVDACPLDPHEMTLLVRPV
jgi:aryl-alcohol dehydrogenase-like predicted oxidoreductase